MTLRFNTKKININITVVIWTLLIFSYYFQVPYSQLSSYIVPLLFTYMFFNYKVFHFIGFNKGIDYLLILFVAYVITSALITVWLDGSSQKVLRFSMILIAIPLCFFIKKDEFRWEYRIFIILSIAKAIFLIVLAIQMEIAGTYIPFRMWARENGFGDAYFVYNIIPRIQLNGNPLLVTSFIVDFHQQKKFTIINLVLLTGVLIEGNFAFILGLVIFFIYEYISTLKHFKLNFMKAAALFLLIIGSVVFILYMCNEISRKKETSNAFRIKQAEILLDANVIVGEGVGQIVPRNIEIGRSPEDNYFELQSLYIFYQIGTIGIGLFYLLTLYMCRSYQKKIFALYVIYLIYSFWNPYCFDTTQMITIITLINLQEKRGKINDKCNYYAVQSG